MSKYNNIIKLKTSQLFQARVHLGHHINKLNLNMLAYIFGIRHNVTIFNIQQLLISFRIIFQIMSEIVKQRGHFFLVGTNKNLPMVNLFKKFMLKHSKIRRRETHFFITGFVGSNWRKGIFSNLMGTLHYLRYIDSLPSYSIKLNSTRSQRHIKDLEGIQKKKIIPDFVFFFNSDKDALYEIKSLNIPIIGVTDSNNSPNDFLFNLPANDDSLEFTLFLFNFLEKAILEGKQKDQERFFLSCLRQLKQHLFK